MPTPMKPRSQRARRNHDQVPQTELVLVPMEPPQLPTKWVDAEGALQEIVWSPLTLDWWRRWCDSPQAAIFSESDWNALLSTAFVADMFFKTRKVTFAAELRQREAAFGGTPVDRLRLRWAWREDEKLGLLASEAEQAKRAREAKERYAGIHAVKDGTA